MGDLISEFHCNLLLQRCREFYGRCHSAALFPRQADIIVTNAAACINRHGKSIILLLLLQFIITFEVTQAFRAECEITHLTNVNTGVPSNKAD